MTKNKTKLSIGLLFFAMVTAVGVGLSTTQIKESQAAFSTGDLTWSEVTAADQVKTDGTYVYQLVSINTSTKAVQYSLGTISSSKLNFGSSSTIYYSVEAKKDTSYFYLKDTNNKYLTNSSSTSLSLATSSGNATAWEFKYSGNERIYNNALNRFVGLTTANATTAKSYQTGQSYQTVYLYKALAPAEPTVTPSVTALTLNAGSTASPVTVSTKNFTTTPTITAEFQYSNVATMSVDGSTISVTPFLAKDIGTYTTDTLTITATAGTEVATTKVSVKVNKQTLNVDQTSINITTGGATKTVTATPSYFDDTPTYLWSIVSDEDNIIGELQNATTATVSVVPTNAELASAEPATIKCLATYGKNQSVETSVTVNYTIPKTVYNCILLNNASDDGTTEIKTTTFANYVSSEGDGSLLTASNISKVYPGKNNSLKFGSSKANGKITFALPDSKISKIIVTASNYVGDTATMSVDGQTVELSDTRGFYSFELSEAKTSVEITSTGTAEKEYRFRIHNIIFFTEDDINNYASYAFAANLLNDTKDACENRTGVFDTWGTAALEDGTLAAKYSALPSASKTIISQFEAVEDGTLIEEMLARYDVIVSNYGAYNFMARELTANVALPSVIASTNSSIITVIIVIIVTVSASSLIILKKRKTK